MTLLGYRNPLRRISNAIAGIRRRRVPSAARRTRYVIGHRGAARFEAENTIPSFARALELGANAVETDVCVTRDGRFVLWHDCKPDDKVALVRQTGEEGEYRYEPDVPAVGSELRRPVPQLTWEELRAHYGYVPRNADGGEAVRVGIVLLDELFEWSKREPRLELLCLDVKLGEKETAAARDLAAHVREAKRSGAVRRDLTLALLCPHRETLQAVLTESRREPLGKNVWIFADFEFPGALDFAKRYGTKCVSFGISRRLWSGFLHELEDVLGARARGSIDDVIVWTVNDEKKLHELVGLAVDGILTDDCARLRKIAGAG